MTVLQTRDNVEKLVFHNGPGHVALVCKTLDYEGRSIRSI